MTYLSEEQLESFIYDNRDKIHERGLPKFYKNAVRQFTLPSKKRIDILTWEIENNILFLRIIELKKDWLWIDGVKQILGYYGTMSFLCAKRFDKINIDLVLIGDILHPTNNIVVELIPNLKAYKYDFGFDGLKFELFERFNGVRKDKFIDHSDKLFSILNNPIINSEYGFGEDFETTQQEVIDFPNTAPQH